jgi:hypothetical protein
VTARRFRAVAAAVAVALVALLLWWLLPGPGAGPSDPANPRAEPSPAAPRAAEPDEGGGFPRGAGEAAARGQRPTPEGPEEETPPAEDEPRAQGICTLEDGKPLAGVQFWFGQKPGRGKTPLHEATGADGTFLLPVDRPAAVSHPHAVPVSAEGGTLTEDGRGGLVVRADADRIRITFRDKPGTAHVRLVDLETNRPVESVAGLRVSWVFPGAMLRTSYPEDPGLGGWIAIPEGRLPETEGAGRTGLAADPAKVEVVLAMPGYEEARLPLLEIRSRMETRVRPVPPDARGEVVYEDFDVEVAQGEFIADPGQESVEARLRWTGPDPAPDASEVQGFPKRVGAFALYGVPDGPWVLEVSATTHRNTVVRGQKAFERRGDTVELGKIALLPAGRVIVRVVDAAEEPIPQAWAVVVRPGEDPSQGRRLDLDSTGTVAVGDLEPGVAHRAIVKGLPREMERTVTAEAKDPKPTFFQWPERLVACRIALSVDGKAVANPDGSTTIPAVVQESPLPRDKGAWRADGVFEARLVPGTYRFRVLATPKEGGPPAMFSGETTVPSGDSFDARLELEREGR